MSDRELRDQLVTLLLAGHETTATALAWTFDLLLHAPAALARAARRAATRARDAYLRAVVAESLRLRPVLPLAGRRLARELRADGYALPAGHRRDARDLAHAHARRPLPAAVRLPPRALPRAPAGDLRAGSRSAAACAAASAPRSPSSRCASSSRPCSTRLELAPASARARGGRAAQHHLRAAPRDARARAAAAGPVAEPSAPERSDVERPVQAAAARARRARAAARPPSAATSRAP